jgi:ligand-binding sensor domain-containing protein/DNA-binding CsgD family transcriptional regulator
LVLFIPEKDRSFGDVWDIVSYQNKIFFRSKDKIFEFKDGATKIFSAPNEWSFLGKCNDKLYAHDYQKGLLYFENDAWIPLPVTSELPLNDPITAILAVNRDTILITTLKSGLFNLTQKNISKINTVNNTIFENARVYAATSVTADWFALATNTKGVFIIDKNGNIIQNFSSAQRLQNNNVLSIFLDNRNNLWLGLDNGIDFIAYSSPIKQIDPSQQQSSGYTALIYNNDLFFGTTTGLYGIPIQHTEDLSFNKGAFYLVNNTNGQNWGLAEINNKLLMGHHEGAFIINNKIATSISSEHGFWNFNSITTSGFDPQMIAGTYTGLIFFNYKNNQFIQSEKVPGFEESSRFVVVDKNNNIWVSHPYHGVYKIVKDENGRFIISGYTNKNGLPSALNNHVYKIKGEVVVATEKGVYEFNFKKNIFEPASFYTKLLGEQSVRYLKEDPAGNVWFIHEKSLGVIDMTTRDTQIIYFPELKNKMLSGFEFIYPVNNKNIFVGGEKGFYHINYDNYKKVIPVLQVQIRSVRIINKTDSLLFGGYFKNVDEKPVQQKRDIPKLNYQWKTMRFEFSSPLFGYQSNLEYSYRLKGFDDNWSEWTKRTEKEYNNLDPAEYTFEVKVRNNLGQESPVAGYSFNVMPPWYQTIWAYAVYFLLFGGLIVAAFVWQQNKFTRQQIKYEEEQKKLLYIHELELNKTESELVTLRNQKLEDEINFKNSELASSGMHLVKKGEMLSKLKAELSHLMKGLDNPQAVTELKKIVRALNEDDNLDKEWENFAKHFDKVHSDFLTQLKETHPAITPNELKLCAYLRMNLTTKEIAQILNISVRGVEIGRYRLRKKLQISPETNLFDYLINIKP